MNMADQILAVPAIACTLNAGDFIARMAWIAELNNTALLGHHRDDLRLELIYAGNARPRVLAMVSAEEACCAFLTFEITDEIDTIHVVIQAPESAREAAETVLDSFQAKTPAGTSCACCGAGS
jgi:hypothetical protein